MSWRGFKLVLEDSLSLPIKSTYISYNLSMPELGMESTNQTLTHECQDICMEIFIAACFLIEEGPSTKNCEHHISPSVLEWIITAKIHTMDHNVGVKINEMHP